MELKAKYCWPTTARVKSAKLTEASLMIFWYFLRLSFLGLERGMVEGERPIGRVKMLNASAKTCVHLYSQNLPKESMGKNRKFSKLVILNLFRDLCV